MDQYESEQQEQEAYYLELNEQTFNVLSKAKPVLTEEELSLLCYHCGFSINDFLKEKE